MDQEAMDILEMVKSGQVSPEQGAQLLEALKNPGSAPVVAGQKARFLRVKVDVNEGGGGDQVAVNLNLPINLADVALKLLQGAKFQRGDRSMSLGDYLQGLGGVDIPALLQLVKEGAAGKLVDVRASEAGGDQVHVEVTVD